LLNKKEIKSLEERVLFEMYDNFIIKNSYKNIHSIKKKIKFEVLCKEYNKRIEFKKILRKLKNKGFIDDHGKSLKVAAVSEFGAKYILEKYFGKK